MPNVVRHKRSTTPGAVPSASSLVTGELAINTADGIVYTKKEDGSVVQVGGGGSSASAVRSDTVGSTSYIGSAAAGSATSASVWTIRRTILTSAGAVSGTTTATSVKWDDRLTATYS